MLGGTRRQIVGMVAAALLAAACGARPRKRRSTASVPTAPAPAAPPRRVPSPAVLPGALSHGRAFIDVKKPARPNGARRRGS
jgi:hypothetical protein